MDLILLSILIHCLQGEVRAPAPPGQKGVMGETGVSGPVGKNSTQITRTVVIISLTWIGLHFCQHVMHVVNNWAFELQRFDCHLFAAHFHCLCVPQVFRVRVDHQVVMAHQDLRDHLEGEVPQ